MRTKIALAKALILFIAIITAALLVPGMVKGSLTGAPVEKTGQTTCWDATGNQIPCTGTGQDGELQKGVAWPIPRFTDNGDGTVKDNLTGLIWLKNANPCDLKNWQQALDYCNSLASGTAGLTDGSKAGDWRLPNVKELQSLIDFSSYNPALPVGHPFTGVQLSDYWLSTTFEDRNSVLAHRLRMRNGTTVHDFKTTTSHYVWPVREDVSTLIKLASFHATPKAGKVIVEWSTASEIDNAGFNLFCSEAANGPYIKLNNSLIPAKGSSTQGSDYEFIDHDVQNRKTYYYKLEDIDLNGTSTMHGPVSATPRLIYGIGR